MLIVGRAYLVTVLQLGLETIDGVSGNRYINNNIIIVVETTTVH